MNERVIEIVQKACALSEEITIDSELKILSLDSLSYVEMLVEIENTFGVEFDIDVYDRLYNGTVGDIVQAVKEQTNG